MNEFDLNIVGTDVLGGPKTMKFDFVYGYTQTLATKRISPILKLRKPSPRTAEDVGPYGVCDNVFVPA